MKKHFSILLSILILSACTEHTDRRDVVDFVNPLIGTMSKFSLSTGNTYPAIAMPWGMNFWTPQTGNMGDGWVYTYSADKIKGFKQTHQPSPWINDYGQFSIMPISGKVCFAQDDRASWFSHKAETVKPYHYGVYLADHDIYAEMVPTERAAAFRIVYPESETSSLVIDAYDKGSFVKVVSPTRVVGYSTRNSGGVPEGFKNYFVIESDTPFTAATLVEDGAMAAEIALPCSSKAESESFHSGVVLSLSTERGQVVNLKVASSFISEEQAELNLREAKLGHKDWSDDFEALLAEGRSKWNEMLSRIEVEDDDTDNLKVFYSCLYRSLLFPRDLSEIDADGHRVHYSVYNGTVCDGYLFADTGFWDTFRCLFALLDLFYPDQAVKVQEGLVNSYKESGFLPEWSSPGHRRCMVGNNSASVVSEAYMKGLRGYDIETLWEALVHDAHAVHPSINSSGRLGWELYDSLGYVPCDAGIRENAARTLEYAYDDWCIYQLGKELGKPDEEIEPYAKAALNYRNLYRPEYKLMSGRKSDGSFPEEFNPLKWGGDFTEGNSLHYTWSVFHDPAGLITLMGGEEEFVRSLDAVFEMPPHFDDSYYGFTIHEIREMQIMNMGNYAHGNQPIQHMLYLYDWGLQPWKAQARIREVMKKFYTPLPDGYCGDEDNGQTSAWYVFSALGFYPVCPASGQYAVGSPLFRKVKVHFPEGDILQVNAPENSDVNIYVTGIKVNGHDYDKTFFTHGQLTHSRTINYEMSSEKNTAFGSRKSDRPYSMSEEK
ncbi:MAG: GH92 family glycosyl hydrolase [Bacteroidales bacterium]|nr:GH92 family glycosyl hydrolase [Bacteroidales bacterium]